MFDPLRLVTPFILVGKCILQELCHDGVGSDNEVADDLRTQWQKWRAKHPVLESLRIARCHKPQKFDVVENVELHHRPYACQNGYGQCSYIQLVDDKNRVHCSSNHTQTGTDGCTRLIKDQLHAAAGAGVCTNERNLLDSAGLHQ